VDPNTTLKDLRGLVQQAFSEDAELVSLNRLITLAEHFDALDEWLSHRGFLPKAWNRN
jgi:hypothetical protein